MVEKLIPAKSGGGQYIEQLILNVTAFVVRVWEGGREFYHTRISCRTAVNSNSEPLAK
jgi:hypothetical protein